jgi:penicillin amidase
MKTHRWLIPLVILIIPAAAAAVPDRPQLSEQVIRLQGLSRPVEILKDTWGISHIYAETREDLFFAQGFNAARDRLFQLELWRRRATGTLSEILGERALRQDIGLRLLKSRVDINQEMRFYHPEGEIILPAFVRGINAWIDRTRENPELLPLEFRLLGIQPGYWTPEVVVSRHNGLFRNLRVEVGAARTVSILGAEKAAERLDLHPGSPDLANHLGEDLGKIPEAVLELYDASRSSPHFLPEDIADPELRARISPGRKIPAGPSLAESLAFQSGLGSNNWVVAGRRTLTGSPILANDPHRSLQIPSLRYWVHLHAPGWDVIGGGEPCLPGISIGHNSRGAWGLTIFAVDQEDLYVYETHPRDPLRYRFRDGWEKMTVRRETIPVRGKAPVEVELKFTRHGPVLYQDPASRRAYALRAAWLEIGGAPYLASLRMDQARTWEEFREACRFSRTPSENMIWADRDGHIGWQAVGITPLRRGWDGLLPVPGDGRFEWEGWLPILSLPHAGDPPEGFFSSSNQDNLPPGYPHRPGFMWAEAYRHARVQEVLGSGRLLGLADMTALQQDWLSIPARHLVPLLSGLPMGSENTRRACDILTAWDFVMAPDSAAAAIYQAWQTDISRRVWDLSLPEAVRDCFPQRSLRRLIDWLTVPDARFGPDPTSGRDRLLADSLERAVSGLARRLGDDPAQWRYGHELNHHVLLRHPLSRAAAEVFRSRLDIGPLPRGGNNTTVNKTSDGFNQRSGATFRLIADCGDWDRSLGTNCPGQSGDPDSTHYRDLFQSWARGRYFPVFFTRAKIEGVTRLKLRLTPGKSGGALEIPACLD